MVISLFFSAALYRVSTAQLDDSLRRQYTRFSVVPGGGAVIQAPEPHFLQQEMEYGHHHLQLQLLYFNLIILIIGSASSYFLAKRTLKPIEDALEAQSRFTADASHELRTPLTAMQTEIEVALRNPKFSKDTAKKLLTSNLEEVAKLRALSEGLLRLARQDGIQELVPVELEQVAVDALNRVIPLAKNKKITVDNTVGKHKVLGDPQSLTELLVILMDNAIKYSEPKTLVIMSATKRGKLLEIQVTDQGQGIKASDLPHIFNRFYRADASRTKQQVSGYGLGLSIAEKIAELHDGSISVQSAPGKGSTFSVKIPLHS
jgi:two-component system, OmpR family, sensor histidine kinase CiaH